MQHLDLFSGIGGAALAVDAIWPDAEHEFCEIDPFCQAVLKKHYPHSKIHGDIRKLTANPRFKHGSTGNEQGVETHKSKRATRPTDVERQNKVDLLTGGFPCQPFSQAGRRKGTEDDRHLWPEMLRVIREFRPRWVVGENVAGLLTIERGLVFEQVCLDLEAAGYEVQALVIPAVAVNAPHRRDRVWIVAHAESIGSGRRSEEICKKDGRQDGKLHPKPDGSDSNDSNSASIGRDNGFDNRKKRYLSNNERVAPQAEPERKGRKRGSRTARAAPRYAEGAGLEGGIVRPREGEHGRAGERSLGWDRDWFEVAARLCGVDDGLPTRMDGLELTKSQHRVERLKGLGNAWVPQVAIEIFRAIRAVDNSI